MPTCTCRPDISVETQAGRSKNLLLMTWLAVPPAGRTDTATSSRVPAWRNVGIPADPEGGGVNEGQDHLAVEVASARCKAALRRADKSYLFLNRLSPYINIDGPLDPDNPLKYGVYTRLQMSSRPSIRSSTCCQSSRSFGCSATRSAASRFRSAASRSRFRGPGHRRQA